MEDANRVTVEVRGGPRIDVPWEQQMTVRGALETAYDYQGGRLFTYALQYYGSELGYLVMMVNEIYDSFDVDYEPDFYWEMLVNGEPAQSGVDGTVLQQADVVTFSYEMRDERSQQVSLTQVKREQRRRQQPKQ